MVVVTIGSTRFLKFGFFLPLAVGPYGTKYEQHDDTTSKNTSNDQIADYFLIGGMITITFETTISAGFKRFNLIQIVFTKYFGTWQGWQWQRGIS